MSDATDSDRPTDNETPRSAPVAHLLEVAHVAHRLSVSQDYVRRLIRDRKLAAIRLGTRWRVDPRDLEAFLDAQRVLAVPLGEHGRRR